MTLLHNSFAFKENSSNTLTQKSGKNQLTSSNTLSSSSMPFGSSSTQNNWTSMSSNSGNGHAFGNGQLSFNAPLVEIPVPTLPVDDIDDADRDDEMQVAEYVNEIYQYLYEKERKCAPGPDVLVRQKEISAKMRGILVDWLVEVHELFKLISETLYLTMHIVDKYLSSKYVSKPKLQLVGVTAMLIACKFEEIYAPEIKDFIYITDGAYSEQHILDMEHEILEVLDFNLSYPTPLLFLRRFSKAAGSDYRVHTLCKYFIEISMVDVRLLNFYPSQIAAASVYIARRMANMNQIWTSNLQYYTGYSVKDLENCILSLNQALIKYSHSANLQTIYTKYADEKYGQVSLIPLIGNETLITQY
jgi:hypothetical protein